MPTRDSRGAPPVQQSAMVPAAQRRAEVTYAEVRRLMTDNDNADAKAIRAMFGGDDDLMKRFLAVVFSALSSNSNLLRDASPMSLVQAIKDSASLGLEPMTQEAGIAVYSGEAKLLPMWRGYVKRIYNSGLVNVVGTQLVYERDLFEPDFGSRTVRHIPHIPAKGYIPADERPPVAAVAEEPPPPGDPEGAPVPDPEVDTRGGYRAVYAYVVFKNGERDLEVMTADEVNEVRRRWGNSRSRDGKPLPWETSWGEMARKTVLRRLAKRLPGSAVDQLLRIEAAADEAAEQARVAAKEAVGALQTVRDMTKLAIAAPVPPPAETAASVASGGAQEVQRVDVSEAADPRGDLVVPGAPERPQTEPVDPMVASAMAMADEEARRGRR